jgi:hypothetical protein
LPLYLSKGLEFPDLRQFVFGQAVPGHVPGAHETAMIHHLYELITSDNQIIPEISPISLIIADSGKLLTIFAFIKGRRKWVAFPLTSALYV